MSISWVCVVSVSLILGSYLRAQSLLWKPCDADVGFAHVKDFLAQKRYDDAAKLLDEIRSCPQLSPLATFELGWLYGRARRFEIALKLLNQVSPAVPDPLTHGYAVALSKFELADYQGTIVALTNLRSRGLSDNNVANLLAVSYSKLAQYNLAYAVLTDQVKKGSKDLSTYLNLITVCAEGGDLTEASQFAAQATTLFPKSAEILIVRGATNSLLGQMSQAIQDFSAAVQFAPDRADARFFLALMDYDQAHYPEAIRVLQQARQDGVDDSDLHYLMAESLLKFNSAQVDPVLAELNQALRLNSDSAPARTLRGRLLMEKGQMHEALADLEAANHSDPAARSTIYNLARVYRALGRNEEAESLFRQLRTENPDTLQEMSNRRLTDTVSGKDRL